MTVERSLRRVHRERLRADVGAGSVHSHAGGGAGGSA
jgi:hypothetical protein